MLSILAIVRRPTNGGPPPFEDFFRRHHARVVGFFRRRGCPDDEVSDLTQETFLRAFDGYGAFRGEAKPATWLLTIATNLWLNRGRARATIKRSADVVSLDAGASVPSADGLSDAATLSGAATLSAAATLPDAATLDDERRRLLLAAIDELPSKMRRCVLLRVYQERSYREIGEILGIREVTAKSQVSRARAVLREILLTRHPELGPDAVDRNP
ncbi:MAG: RNA polymerase sigma factor [Acidobacteriota bacterium]